MSELFLTVLNMSLTASYVILFVILIRLPLKKAPKIISYVLWSVVAFRLIIPFSFESIFSLMPRNTNAVPIPHDIIYQQSPQINSGIEVVDSFVNGSLPAPIIGASVNPLQIYVEIGAYIWVLGIIALLVYSLGSIFFLKRQLKSAQLKDKNIFEAKNLKTPFVLGLVKPKIYLPAGINDEEKTYILLHEQTHIHRKDHIIKILSFLILSLHWFNPLVWIAFILMSRDMELSCDERVLKKMNEDIKKEYANSLLSLATGRHILNASPLAFGEGNVKGRIKNVLNYKKPRFWVSLVGIVIIIVVGIGLLSNPNVKKSEEEVSNSNDKELEEASNLKITDIVEVSKNNIVSPEITTLFKPKVTELKTLTNEDHQLYDVITTRLNTREGYIGDRDVVYEIADEYGEDQEEFYNNWIEISNQKTYGNEKNTATAILSSDMFELVEDIIRKNIVGDNVHLSHGGYDQEDFNKILFSTFTVIVDGDEHEVYLKVKFSEDYREAELIEFKVDKKLNRRNQSK